LAETAKLYRELAAMQDKNVLKHDQAATLIKKIETNAILEIENKRLHAFEEVADRLDKIRVVGVIGEIERHKQEMETKLQEDYAYLRQLGFAEQDANRKLSAFRKEREAEFHRWEIEETKKQKDKLLQQEKRFNDAVLEERLARDKVALDNARKIAEANIAAGKFLLSQGQGASKAEIKQFFDQLKELGPAFQDVDQDAEKTRAAIEYVANAFGFGARSAAFFQLSLDLLTGRTVTFGQVTTAIFTEMFTTVQGLTAIFQGVGQAVSSVFEGIITGTENAKSAFLNFLATILMQMGQMALAIGTIMLFIPGYGGLGGGLIAAGIAAMALAGVFRGLASNAQKAAQGGSSAAAGGSASSGGAVTGSGRSTPPTNVIPFPTSSSRNNQPMIIQLDRNLSNDLIEGRQVLTRPNIQGKHKDVIRKVANL
jgi:hypothetical protein